MNFLNVVYTSDGILLSPQMKAIPTRYSMDETWEHFAKWNQL